MFTAFAASSASDPAPLNMHRTRSLPTSVVGRVSRLKVFSGNAGRDEVRASSNSTPSGSPSNPPPLLPPVPEGGPSLASHPTPSSTSTSPHVTVSEPNSNPITPTATAQTSPESRAASLAGSDDERDEGLYGDAASETSVELASTSGSKWGLRSLNPFRSRKRPGTAPSPIIKGRSRIGSGDANAGGPPAFDSGSGLGLGLNGGTGSGTPEEKRGRSQTRRISIQEPSKAQKDKERGLDPKDKDKKKKGTRSKSNSLTSTSPLTTNDNNNNSTTSFAALSATTSCDSARSIRTRGSIGTNGTNGTTDSLPLSTSPSDLQQQASSLILGAMSGPGAAPTSASISSKDKKSGAAVSGAMGMLGLKAAAAVAGAGNLTANDARGRVLPSQPVGSSKASSSREDRAEKQRRAPSPFFRARKKREEARKRDTSPEIGALAKEKDESDGESVVSARRSKYRPQASAYDETDASDDDRDDSDSDDERAGKYGITEHMEGREEDDDEVAWDDEIEFDDETLRNTEANAVFYEGDAAGLGGSSVYQEERLDNYGEEIEQDILGEGPNVIVPPAPLFQGSVYQPAKKETLKSGLELETSRPVYARDRCTIVLTHGEPDQRLEESGKRLRRYVVLSDLSEESRYAVEWAVGTVARDGDEVFLISVKEEEGKVDPKQWSNSDRVQKLRVQKEVSSALSIQRDDVLGIIADKQRQTGCLLLTRQVTGLLQRTHLNITITCQFLHAKNARHMLLDLIDFLEPTMVIVGSRGLGKLKGILLGSTSHYLVQKSSVPIMVARRRLQRPLRKTNPANLRHAPRVGLAGASIEKTASSKQEDDVLDVAEQEKAEMAEEKEQKEREKAGAGKRGSV